MARSFNGSSDVIDCGGGTGPLAIAQNGTMAMAVWAKFPSFGSPRVFMAKGYDGTRTCYQFTENSSTTIAFSCFYQAVHGASATHGFTINTWHHIYGDYDGSAWHIYFDGQIKATSNDAVGPQNNTRNFTFGAVVNNTPGTYTQFSDAITADGAVWSAPLSSGEISALAAGIRPWMIRSQTLLGYWPLDGLASPESDLSGNKNNGTLTGTALAAGPPIMMFTPRWPLNTPTSAAAVTSVFRKTASRIGTRTGTRQTWAA